MAHYDDYFEKEYPPPPPPQSHSDLLDAMRMATAQQRRKKVTGYPETKQVPGESTPNLENALTLHRAKMGWIVAPALFPGYQGQEITSMLSTLAVFTDLDDAMAYMVLRMGGIMKENPND